MSNIHDQVHDHFKTFAGSLDADGGIGALATQVPAWVKSAGAAPKSIGIEYIEGAKKLLLTVGYRTDEAGYEIALTTVNIGKVESLEGAGLTDLEGRMGKAAAGVKNIICHELFVTADHSVHMVFMTHA
ncbi:hypothetical protein L6V77_29235 [Myxococcota bacterium]|nr:hypothetical protein [Myxococcota bacterium]